MQIELSIREKYLFDLALAKAQESLDETLLEECAELDYRLCLVELGINDAEQED